MLVDPFDFVGSVERYIFLVLVQLTGNWRLNVEKLVDDA